MDEYLLLERRLEATATVCTHRHGDRRFCGGLAVARITVDEPDLLTPTLYTCQDCLAAFLASGEMEVLVDTGRPVEIALLAMNDRRN